MESNQTPFLGHVMNTATGATSLDATLNVAGKPTTVPASSSRVGCKVVLPRNSGVGESFPLSLNAEFSEEYLGFFCSV